MNTANAPSMALNKRVESEGLVEFFINIGQTSFQLFEKGGVGNEINELLVITQGGCPEDFRLDGHD
jgi:hypothetical protein